MLFIVRYNSGSWHGVYSLLYKLCYRKLGTLEVNPKEKGIDTRNELIKFYEENYSANLMHLVVHGKGRALPLYYNYNRLNIPHVNWFLFVILGYYSQPG